MKITNKKVMMMSCLWPWPSRLSGKTRPISALTIMMMITAIDTHWDVDEGHRDHWGLVGKRWLRLFWSLSWITIFLLSTITMTNDKKVGTIYLCSYYIYWMRFNGIIWQKNESQSRSKLNKSNSSYQTNRIIPKKSKIT